MDFLNKYILRGNDNLELTKPDFYTNDVRKIVDFIMGFVGYLLLCKVLIRINGGSDKWIYIMFFLVVVYFIVPAYFFEQKRKFISYGILFFVTVPIILLWLGLGSMASN